MLLQFVINGLIIGSVYAMLGTGFSLVYQTTRIFHIAYAILYMAAGYFAFSLIYTLKFPIILAFLLAVLLTAFVSIVMDKLVYSFLLKKKANENTILIASLGIMIVGINLIALFYGNETKILNPAIAGSVTLGEYIITYPQLYQFVLSITALLILYILLKYTSLGLKIRAVKDNPILAEVNGIAVVKIRFYLFLISGLMAATAGILMGNDIGFDPYVGLPMLLNAVVAMIIGGNKNFQATLLGGLLLGILQALVIWKFSANWQEAVTFVLLIFFLLFRPQGIWGIKTRFV